MAPAVACGHLARSRWLIATRARTRSAMLVRRTAGALHHAFWLRLHVRHLEMITHDLRYGWRMMLRKPGFTAAAV
jgi:hypothetical protein